MMIFEILWPCLSGTLLTLASDSLSSSLFHSDWSGESKEFKTAMIIFMENAKKSKKISAFGIFELSLENFLKIVNSAYSLYAVVKNFTVQQLK